MSASSASSGKAGSNRAEEKAAVSVDQFDYIQCTVPDIHGTPRGRIVPRHLVPKIMHDGYGLFQGVAYFGLNMEIAHNLPDYYDTANNGIIMPIANTLRPLAWSSTPTRRMGHVISSVLAADGSPDTASPRYIAALQVKRLENLGITIQSAYEMEFKVFEDGDSTRPVGKDRKQYCNVELLDLDLEFFMDLMDTLRACNLPIELFNQEYDPGQYEITMMPTKGLESPDAVYLARYAIRAFSRRRGYEATFMARPTFRDFASGFHLNHSLWDSNGRDVFFDSADPQKLSVFAKHWIAGLVHHTPALCALFSPTVNCYHRFASGLAPSTVYWNFDDRLSAYRAKTSQTGAYLENRLPSSACNPYITFAATIAAGLDGVERKLECPAPGRPEEGAIGVPVIPKTLGEALDWLEKDTALVEALGGKMVEYFAALKREFEIKHFKNNTSTDMSKAEVIDIERKYYMPFI